MKRDGQVVDEPGGDALTVLVDCDRCPVRGLECDGCVVAALIGVPADSHLDAVDRRVLAVLADAGLIPRGADPLRLLPGA